MGLQEDKAEGLKWYHRALDAGDGMAAFHLGSCYWQGDGVERDMEKGMGHYHKSAELGVMHAFSVIGRFHLTVGEIEEGILNLRKAAMCGTSMGDDSIFKDLRDGFKYGYITKDEYAFTLREYQAPCNEMKSDMREQWERFMNKA